MSILCVARCKPVERIALDGEAQRTLEYWQSLREGNALPSRDRFSPAHVKLALPRLMLMQVWPHERLVCRLAGTAIGRIMGGDLTGTDILASTPVDFRVERLRRYSNCFDGFLHWSQRIVKGADDTQIKSGLLILPFADISEDGSHQALVYVSWSPADYDGRLRTAESAFVAPEQSQYFAV